MKKRPTTRLHVERTATRFNVFTTLAFLLILVVIGALAFLAHGIATGAAAAKGPQPPTATCQTVHVIPDYANVPQSLSDLKAMSVAAVEVTITHYNATQAYGTAPHNQPASVYSLWSATVQQIVWRHAGAQGASIAQPGATMTNLEQGDGVYQCNTYLIDGDRLFQIGEKDVVFLRYVEHGGQMVYQVIDDTAGRFLVGPDGHLSQIGRTTIPLSASALASVSALTSAVATA